MQVDPSNVLAVAYVMTDYPKLAMTFISGELDEVERRGHRVVPIAMNAPTARDVADAEGRHREQACLYLKRGGWRPLAGSVLRTLRRHPLNLARLVVFALRSARLDLTLMVRRLAHVAYGALVVEHCRTEGIRHLHAHFGQSPASIAWFAALVGNWESDESWTWSFTIHGFQDFVDDKDARLDLKAQSAEFVVCISDFTRSQLCRITDPDLWSRFHVVRCGIDLARFAQRPEPVHTDAPRIVTVGRLSPEKGHPTLLAAIRRMRVAAGIDVGLDVVGDGPYRERLQRQATELGIAEHVTFHGELPPESVVEHLREADAFCLPSYSEGLPVSIMESMAVGVPVVATHIAGIPELAVDGETAMTVAPGNAEELASALTSVVTDRELRVRLVRNARAAVEMRHSLERNVRELIVLFTEACDGTQVRSTSLDVPVGDS